MKIVTASQKTKRHPDWQTVFSEVSRDQLPWFTQELDADVVKALDRFVPIDSLVWDLGCGEGTQSHLMADRGYRIIGTDVSQEAIAMAQDSFLPHEKLEFLVEDVFAARRVRAVDAIVDRGCFHVLSPAQVFSYIDRILPNLKDQGILILKSFAASSELDPGVGPHRYSEAQLKDILKPLKHLDSIEGQFMGPREYHPQSLTLVLKKGD
ncbi:MAG: class I SAM-dependent methyltransferase [Pseudobacteriovorax sp.]|nr:class I SAM-dependent methyltransferase [Pseudobacteriovorax sp.]